MSFVLPLLSVVVIMLSTVGVAFADATWSALVTVASGDATNADVKIDGSGNVFFKWEQSDGTNWRLRTRTRTAGGVLRGVRNVSRCCDDAGQSQMAVDTAGNAVFAWVREASDEAFVVETRTRPAGSPFAERSYLDTVDPNTVLFGPTPEVALGPGGLPVVAWAGNFDTIWTDRSEPPLSNGSFVVATDPRVGVDAAGNAVFAWIGFGFDARVQVRTISSTGTRSAIETISGADVGELAMAVAADGTAAFVWMDFDGVRERVRARTRSAAGVLGDIVTLANTAEDACDPHVAVNASGNFVFVWTRFDGTDVRIQARTLSAAGVLGPVRTVSPAGESAGEPRVVLDADGDAWFTYTRFDGTNDRVWGGRLGADNVLSDIEPLSAGGEDAFAPRIAIGPDGRAIVVYETAGGDIIAHVSP